VERYNGFFAAAEFCCEGRNGVDPLAGAKVGLDSLLQFDKTLNPLFRVVSMKEGRNHSVADRARDLKRRIDRFQQRTQLGLGRLVRMVTDPLATFFRLLQVIAHELADKGRRLRRVPMRGGNLRRRQSDEAVPAFERVVEEGEFMVPSQGRQPQR
jgi:hypothetical protein